MFRVALLAALCACAGVQQRFPDDVQAALARDNMRRLDTERFIIYYAAPRRAEIERFVLRADRCAEILRAQAIDHGTTWGDKMVIVMPDVAFNNAFVLPQLAGYEQIAVIPTSATLDFATEFGIPPDPGFIACHELVHYVHFQQLSGVWGSIDRVFGHIYNPQLGYDPWLLEGLATHYEATLSPGTGRPTWPIFTGFFAAAYAGHHVGGGELSSLGRHAPMGHQYLVGSMFVRFATERYGEHPLWLAIGDQARRLTGWFFTGTFEYGFGVSFAELLDQFDAWVATTFPVRRPPPGQRALATLGNDARYARGRDGTEAWVADDVDLPPRLVVRDATDAVLAELPLIDIVPPRALVQADPLMVSGLSITADGREVWLTAIDLGTTYQVTRLLRWRRGDSHLTEMAAALGPGATIDPTGAIYYYCAPDGDRWSLAAWDVRTGERHMVVDMAPGTYVLGAQASADGRQLVASVWDGSAFVAWVIDAATGAVTRRIPGVAYDPSFTSDGRVMWLGVVAGRFQVFVDGVIATDAPYAVLAARETGGTIRFLDREGWTWQLAEIAMPVAEPAPVAATAPAPAQLGPVRLDADAPYCPFDHLWYPQERAPLLLATGDQVMVGAVIGGGDRLGQQRWSIAGYIQPVVPAHGSAHVGGDVEYLNTMLAPISIIAAASWIDWAAPIAGSSTIAEQRRTRDASLTIARTWRGSLTATASAVMTDDDDLFPGQPTLRRRLAGPELALAYLGAEATRYTDLRRAVFATGHVAAYPASLSTFAGNITDIGGELGLVVPLPLGRRHTLTASVRGRALLARFDTGLLQLGGDAGFGEVWDHSSGSPGPGFDDSRFPPELRFVEPLRGYEDFAITTDRATIGDATWRYPIIIDRGVAATARVLPASFVRQVDLAMFGAGAIDRAGDRHVAAGGAITLELQLVRLPLAVTYQLARRLTDDQALVQLVALAPLAPLAPLQ